MHYKSEPKFIRPNSRMYNLLSSLQSSTGLNKEVICEDSDLRPVVDSSIRFNFVKAYKTGRMILTAKGKKLLKTANG